MLVAYALIIFQILLLLYFLFFAFYNYRNGIASLFKSNIQSIPHTNPKTAVVIVSFNEQHVVAETVEACERLSYKNKHIIVGDDSNDKVTYEILKKMVIDRGGKQLHNKKFVDHNNTEVWESERLTLFHRKHNHGFKAGNLKELESYLQEKNFEYMYLLDAEWEPQVDTLERTLEVIQAHQNTAFIQTKRINLNRCTTNMQICLALNEDGAYFVDLPGRQNMGDVILFAGCAALFDLKKLYEAEGFKVGHLTEDIDLTNRFYLLGYKGIYLGSVKNYGEAPPDYKSLRKQQKRWTTGSARTFREYFWPVIFSKKLSLHHKLGMLRQNMFFTTSIAIEMSMIVSILTILFLALSSPDSYSAGFYQYLIQQIAPIYSFGIVFALLSNIVPQVITVIKEGKLKYLLFIPYATWISWSIVHTYFLANLQGFFLKNHTWFRTPKKGKKGVQTNQVESSWKARYTNLISLGILVFIYSIEYFFFGIFDYYSFFWVPALVIGSVMS